jgi:hypothetical protein
MATRPHVPAPELLERRFTMKSYIGSAHNKRWENLISFFNGLICMKPKLNFVNFLLQKIDWLTN